MHFKHIGWCRFRYWPAPGSADRPFEPPAPNRKWIAATSPMCGRQKAGSMWLSSSICSLDAWSAGRWCRDEARLVTDALMMAIWRRGKPDALLHHSDRGSQYTSEQLQKLMAGHGVICSMSRSGNVWDNAAMESFFSSPEPSAQHARRIGCVTKPRLTCSITSSSRCRRD